MQKKLLRTRKEISKDNVKTMEWHVKAGRMIQLQYVT